jgi:hypothetical protein
VPSRTRQLPLCATFESGSVPLTTKLAMLTPVAALRRG